MPNGRQGKRGGEGLGTGLDQFGVAARYGFRLVEHVHIRVDNGSSVATVTGTARRYPQSVRVPLAVAAQFVAAGTPLTVERTEPPHVAVTV